MSRQLKMVTIDTIRTLKRQGHSNRKIASLLGIHRDTVNKYVSQMQQEEAGEEAKEQPGGSKPAKLHAGSDAEMDSDLSSQSEQSDADPSPDSAGGHADSHADLSSSDASQGADASVGNRGRVSQCERYREQIQAKLKQGLTAQRIFQDLQTEHSFDGSYSAVQRFVAKLKRQTPLPFRRMECEPGEELQIDFGTGVPTFEPYDQPREALPKSSSAAASHAQRANNQNRKQNGKQKRKGRWRKVWVFRAVLSYSRKGYSEGVHHQTTDEFLRVLENTFFELGGVPRRIVLDNLRAAVTRADWYEPELHPKIRAFAEHYGTVFMPTKVATPRHKGKVERGVDYVQENGLRGRQFDDLDAENKHLREWEATVADTRIHGTTRRQVLELFEEEKPALLPLPANRFPMFHEKRRKVHQDGHVEVDKAYYSVPPEYLGQSVWVRWDGRLVKVYRQTPQGELECIATHPKQPPGKFATRNEHIPRGKVSAMERGAADYLYKISDIGAYAADWAQKVIEQRGSQGVRVLLGLLNLAKKHSESAVNRACGKALNADCYHLKSVRKLIDQDTSSQKTLGFMQKHEVIRNLSDYDEVVSIAFRKNGFEECEAEPLPSSPPERSQKEGASPASSESSDVNQPSSEDFPPITIPFTDYSK